jgi:hypothetical protein
VHFSPFGTNICLDSKEMKEGRKEGRNEGMKEVRKEVRK